MIVVTFLNFASLAMTIFAIVDALLLEKQREDLPAEML